MAVYVKGYDTCIVTKDKIKKEILLSELKSVDPDILNKLESAFQEEGYVIGLKKKSILKAVYIFKKNKTEKSLIFSEAIMTDDIEKESINKFEESIVEELKEKVSMDEIKMVDWNDIEIVPNNKFNFFGTPFVTCLAIGILLGLVFNNIGLGLLFGMGIGLCYGSVVKRK